MRLSKAMTPVRLHAGEPVDCWYDDGWWEGYVHVTRDDSVDVFFPGNNDIVTVREDQSDVPNENDRYRLRWEFLFMPCSARCRSSLLVKYMVKSMPYSPDLAAGHHQQCMAC